LHPYFSIFIQKVSHVDHLLNLNADIKSYLRFWIYLNPFSAWLLKFRCVAPGNVSNALADLKEAVTIIESVRRRLLQDTERLSFFGEGKGHIYARLIMMLHEELHRDDEALDYVERSRAFLDVLEARGLILPEGGEGEPLCFQQLVRLLG
jgi:hypothetical protein